MIPEQPTYNLEKNLDYRIINSVEIKFLITFYFTVDWKLTYW